MSFAQVMRKDFAIGAFAIVFAVVVSYLPVTRAGFIWDDDDYVTQNQALRTAGGLAKIWFEPAATPQYYPLVHTSFWIEYRLWRLNPLGYHLLNVALHAIAAVLLWRVLAQLQVPGAWIAALLFAIHPIEVESVAWVTERKNVLSLAFYLAALLTFLRGGESNRRLYGLTLLLFIAALLSKSVACSLPAAILLILWWKRGHVTRRDLLRLTPMFAIGLAMGLLTAWLEKVHVGAQGRDWSLTFAQRILIAGRALWFYAARLLWPVDLTFIYPRWRVEVSSFSQWLFPLTAAGVMTALWGLRRRIGRGPLVAVLLFAGTLLPALGFIDLYPMRYSFVADHFQYVAGIALITLAVATVARHVHRRVFATASCVVGLTLATLTCRQCAAYHDLRTLWEDTLAKNPDCWMAENNLAVCLLNAGEYPAAERHARRSLKLDSSHPEAESTLGVIFARQGRTDEAAMHYAAAVRIQPRFVGVRVNWGVMLARTHHLEEAHRHLMTALALDPRNVEALYNLAALSVVMDRSADAEHYYRRAIDLAPGHLLAHMGLATLLASENRPLDAVSIARQAIEIARESADPRQLIEIERWQHALLPATGAAAVDPADALSR